MSNPILKNQIIDWLKNQPYWLQFSGNQVLEGHPIDDSLISDTLILFKEDNGLKEIEHEQAQIEYNEIEATNNATDNSIILESIKDIENVNALVSGQEIPINNNLTIIYGNNGTGKSGYIRLLNNAFYNSRGDKNILPNVFLDASNATATGRFVFNTNGKSINKTYPDDENCAEFSRFSVFDSESVKVHLDKNNQLNFTPIGFDFFEKISELFELIKAEISPEITEARKSNSFLIHFQNDNEIRKIVESLGAQTEIKKLKAVSAFNEEDSTKLEEIKKKIAALKSLNIQQQISSYEKLQRELAEFTKHQQTIINAISKEKLEYHISLIDSYHKTQALVNSEGIKSLEQYNIEQIGGQSWRDFIHAAEDYRKNIEQSKNIQTGYPQEGDRCLFCLQPISNKEKSLIETYWKLLKSQAESELNRIKRDIQNSIIELRNLPTVVFNDTTSLFLSLQENYSELAKKWQWLVNETEKVKINQIKNLENLNYELEVKPFNDNTESFVPISKKLQNRIDELFKKKPDQELATLTFQLTNLTDKSLLSKLLPQLLDFVSAHKWALKAEKSLVSFRTNALTTLQGNIFKQHITEKYTALFNDECEFLKAPSFVEIKQQNSKLKTFRKLSIVNTPASQILSEGEQRAISLADFLTEIQLNPLNIGVVFDDPVTSLDHQRRALIAERLVKLAKTKQVIIFTHDISFFAKLTHTAKLLDIATTQTTIRKIGNTVGLVGSDLPWVAQKIKDRIKFLRNLLVRLQKLEKEGQDDEFSFQVKGWYGLLREAWERCVEERLFKGVIERFSGEIHTKPLERLVITEEFIKMINDGMTQASNWVHDQAMGLNPPIPDSKKAETDLELLIEFSEKCKNQ